MNKQAIIRFTTFLGACLIAGIAGACTGNYPDTVVDRPASIFYLDVPATASADATFSVTAYYANTSGSPTTYALPDTFAWKLTAPDTVTISGMGKAVKPDPRDTRERTQSFQTSVGKVVLSVSLPSGTYSVEIAPANYSANIMSQYREAPTPRPASSLVVN